jgi:hypothetical protein
MSKAWSKDIIVEQHTFGGTKACEVLAAMMNQNMIPTFEKHRVLSFICDATMQFKHIASISYKPVMVRTLVLMRDHLLARIDKMPYPIDFNTHMKNVLHHHCRKYLD